MQFLHLFFKTDQSNQEFLKTDQWDQEEILISKVFRYSFCKLVI